MPKVKRSPGARARRSEERKRRPPSDNPSCNGTAISASAGITCTPLRSNPECSVQPAALLTNFGQFPWKEAFTVFRVPRPCAAKGHPAIAVHKATAIKALGIPRDQRKKAAVSENMQNARQACRSSRKEHGMRRARRPSIRCPDTPAKRNVKPVTCPHP